jgi:hypothetical protein
MYNGRIPLDNKKNLCFLQFGFQTLRYMHIAAKHNMQAHLSTVYCVHENSPDFFISSTVCFICVQLQYVVLCEMVLIQCKHVSAYT